MTGRKNMAERALNGSQTRKLYELLATLRYNQERVPLIEILLKDFLLNPNKDIGKLIEDSKEKSSFSSLFKEQDTILSSSIPDLDAISYIEQRYGKYNEIFRKKYGIGLDTTFSMPLMIMLRCINKAKELNFKGGMYIFQNKEEYGNLDFFKLPSEDYINKWKKVITFTKDELKGIGNVSAIINYKALDFFCFTLEELDEDRSLRFQEFPILKINDKYTIVNQKYLLRYLPQKFEILLKDCEEYNRDKGKVFEKMALELLEKIPNSKLTKNIKYGDYELDAILQLSDYSWFVECSSRCPSINSLKGDKRSVLTDLKRSILKCVNQAKRAIEHIDDKEISKYVESNRKVGIIIILEGIYPNLTWTNVFDPIELNCPVRIFIINYFDLQKIMKEKEINYFKDFLVWRTQENMPIKCMDEADYWGYYFDRYHMNDRLFKKAFKLAQSKQMKIFYISARFNDKTYLSKIANEHLPNL